MAEPRLRTVNKAVAPFAVNKFPSSFVETLAQNIVYMMATKQSMSLEGNEWEQDVYKRQFIQCFIRCLIWRLRTNISEVIPRITP